MRQAVMRRAAQAADAFSWLMVWTAIYVLYRFEDHVHLDLIVQVLP